MSDKPAAPAEGEEQPKKKNKLVLILAAVVLLAGAGGGAFWFLNKDKHKDPAEEHVVKVEPIKPPVFVKLDAFTVNLAPEAGEQFLQLVVELKVADDATAKTVKDLMPEIRHRYLMLLSGKKSSQISTPQGRDTLALEMRSIANQVVLYAQGRLQAQPPHMVPAQPAPQGNQHGQLDAPGRPASLVAAAEAAKPEAPPAPAHPATPAAKDPKHAAPAPAAAGASQGVAPAGAPQVVVQPVAPAVPAATLVYSPRADDPVQGVLFTSFIIQ